MTSIQTKSEARTLTGTDSPECSSFFVFHSPLHRPDENLHIADIEARFLAASASSIGYESQEGASNPDVSELNMESPMEDNTWAFYPNSMQVVGSSTRGSISNGLSFTSLRKTTCTDFAIRLVSIHKEGTVSYPATYSSEQTWTLFRMRKSIQWGVRVSATCTSNGATAGSLLGHDAYILAAHLRRARSRHSPCQMSEMLSSYSHRKSPPSSTQHPHRRAVTVTGGIRAPQMVGDEVTKTAASPDFAVALHELPPSAHLLWPLYWEVRPQACFDTMFW
jgi:hypothetical protein